MTPLVNIYFASRQAESQLQNYRNYAESAREWGKRFFNEKNLENRKERYSFVSVASGSNSPQDHPRIIAVLSRRLIIKVLWRNPEYFFYKKPLIICL